MGPGVDRKFIRISMKAGQEGARGTGRLIAELGKVTLKSSFDTA